MPLRSTWLKIRGILSVGFTLFLIASRWYGMLGLDSPWNTREEHVRPHIDPMGEPAEIARKQAPQDFSRWTWAKANAAGKVCLIWILTPTDNNGHNGTASSRGFSLRRYL